MIAGTWSGQSPSSSPIAPDKKARENGCPPKMTRNSCHFSFQNLKIMEGIQTTLNLYSDLTLKSICIARLNPGAYDTGTNSHEEHGQPRRRPRSRHPIAFSFSHAEQNAHSKYEFKIECQGHVDCEFPVTLPLCKNQQPEKS